MKITIEMEFPTPVGEVLQLGQAKDDVMLVLSHIWQGNRKGVALAPGCTISWNTEIEDEFPTFEGPEPITEEHRRAAYDNRIGM